MDLMRALQGTIITMNRQKHNNESSVIYALVLLLYQFYKKDHGRVLMMPKFPYPLVGKRFMMPTGTATIALHCTFLF